jgi:hypothetical protein
MRIKNKGGENIRYKGLVLALFFLAAVWAMSATASAAFLCPVVGDGVNNADARNGDNGVSAINPPVGTSFLPGNNQAGANANPNAYNTDGPGNPNAGPGKNPNFSPIWP